MADWYVSSAAWTAITQFAASHAYTVGNIVRPLTAPAFGAQYAFRCTTAGTSSTEPSWPVNNTSTVTTGGATFTNVTGQSTYGWGAAAGNIVCMTNAGSGVVRFVVGDRVFLSSDHAESATSNTVYAFVSSNTFGVVEVISVNRAGSVPPVSVDYLAGAAITYTGTGILTLDPISNDYWQGVTFTAGGSCQAIFFASGGFKAHYFKNCAFVFTTSNTTAYFGSGNPAKVTFDNTTVTFNNAGQRFQLNLSYVVDFTWINTPAATLGTVPTVLFSVANSSSAYSVTCRGVDLSAVTTTLCYGGTGSLSFLKPLFDSCRIASGVVRLGTGGYNTAADEVELVNCYDGTSFLAERHTPAGDLTTEFTITLTGGAQDDIGYYSHKMVSSSRSDKFVMSLESFWMDVENTTTGSSKTATVEIISSTALNNDEIALYLQYEGTSGSSIASFVSSFAGPLLTGTAVTSSSATWNSSPSTPQKQKLQVTFTPQQAGRLRGQVRLGKASTTVYVDPRIVVT